MSFFTSLMFYRPTNPPTVTGESLANFVRAFGRLGISQDDGLLTVRVKFGKTIDQDERPSSWSEPIGQGQLAHVCECKEIEWDLDKPRCKNLNSIAQVLSKYKQPVYRAYISLGSATEDIIGHLYRKASKKNNHELCLEGWSFEVEPIMSFDLSSSEFFVGWLAVNIAGHGYLNPWTFSELIGRAEKHSGMRKMMDLCRKTWPVKTTRPNGRIIKLRKKMDQLWPYRKYDLPWDWYWGLAETG